MRAKLDRIRNLCIRLHAMYLSVDDLEDQGAFIDIQNTLLGAQMYLCLGKDYLYDKTLEVFVDLCKKFAKELRVKYGESMRGKMRRIAEAADKLRITSEEFRELTPVSKGQRGLRPYEIFSLYARSYLWSGVDGLRYYYDGIVFFNEEKAKKIFPGLLIELRELCLFLKAKDIDGMSNQNWRLTREIMSTIETMRARLYELRDMIDACAYKCKVYGLINLILEMSHDLSLYYVEEYE